MIKYFKSDTPGIVEKHTIELIDVTVLEKEKAEKVLQLAEHQDSLSQEEIDAENSIRIERKQLLQQEITILDDTIKELKKVKAVAPEEL